MNCYVDIETTGFSPKGDAITRITAMKAHGYEMVDIFDRLVNPGRRVDPKILKMTGLTQKVLDASPLLAEIRPFFLAFAKNSRLISWSGFENKWLPHHGLATQVFDAIKEVKKKTQGRLHLANYKLPTVCQHFKIPLRHHDSLSDTLAVYHICNLTGAFR